MTHGIMEESSRGSAALSKGEGVGGFPCSLSAASRTLEMAKSICSAPRGWDPLGWEWAGEPWLLPGELGLLLAPLLGVGLLLWC